MWYGYLAATGKKEAVARWPEPDDMPIEIITRQQARAFCAWLSEEAGVRVRLPVEREWCEDARREPGGPEGTSKYPPGPTVHLGGGCHQPAENQGCGQRVFWARDMSDLGLGFRPVFSVPDDE